LESNSDSTLSIEMARSYVAAGFDVVCLNSRGCSGIPNTKLGFYHLGFNDDLYHLLNLISKDYGEDKDNKKNQWPIYLSGFSMEANIVLKTLGELGSVATTRYSIRGAAVTGAPFDLERSAPKLAVPGFNRMVYTANFLKTLKERALGNLERYGVGVADGAGAVDGGISGDIVVDAERIRNAKTLMEFDDAWVAPVFGFENEWDYYRQSACGVYLDGVTVPTLVVNAADDPFFYDGDFPWEKGCDVVVVKRQGSNEKIVGGKLPIKLLRTEHGGHLGYMFHQLDDAADVDLESSWMPTELTRFLCHVRAHDDDSDSS